MAPKSTLLTAGTTPQKKRGAPIRPLTTQGKIARAAAKAEKARKNVPRSPPPDSKPKPRSLAPPGEGLVVPKSARGANKNKSSRYSKPLTTQQKIRAMEAAKRAKGPQTATKASAQEASAKITGPGWLMQAMQEANSPAKAAKVKPSGMSAVLRSQDASVQQFTQKRESIMYRRTQRTEMYLRKRKEEALRDPVIKSLWEEQGVQGTLEQVKRNGVKMWQALSQKKEGKWVEVRNTIQRLVRAGVIILPPLVTLDGKEQEEVFRLMDLPKELRVMIFELVVLESKVFIYPDSVTGREQPDLAMVNKQIRGEVLPAFYGKNTFAIDLSPDIFAAKVGKPENGVRRPVTGMVAIEKWAGVLEEGGSFSMVRKWVFNYTSQGSWLPDLRTTDDSEDSSVMVSVNFIREEKSKSWGAIVEVHREAACIMPGISDHGLCVVKRAPEGLNEAVINVLKAAKRGSISGGTVVKLAKAIKVKAPQLAEWRCEKAVRSIEVDSGFGGD